MYTKVQGDSKTLTEYYHERTAQECAPYLLPYIKPTSNILDVGSGLGSITKDLSLLAPYGTTTGIDSSPGGVTQATTTYPPSHFPNLQFQVGNALKLDFPDDTLDIIHSHCTVMHLGHPGLLQALKEMYRVCKKGGLVAICDCNTNITSFKPEIEGVLDWWKHAESAHYRAGTHPHAGDELAAFALEAGFRRVEAKKGELKITPPFGGPCSSGEAAERCLELGMGTKEQIEGWDKAWKEWATQEEREWVHETVQMLAWKGQVEFRSVL